LSATARIRNVSLHDAVRYTAQRMLRSYLYPLLGEFDHDHVHLESTALLERFGVPANDPREFLQIHDQLSARARSLPPPQSFPWSWGINAQTGLILDHLVRKLRPGNVVETGTGNGYSTMVLLGALGSQGSMDTFDLVYRRQSLIPDPPPPALHPHEGDVRHSSDFLRMLGQAGLFHHDSDHGYRHMRWELETAYRLMRPGSVIVADDVNVSYAFLDFCAQHRLVPEVLLTTEKMLGVVRR
jgi:methyltransferase family protein